MTTLLKLSRTDPSPIALGEGCALPRRVFAQHASPSSSRAAVAAALAKPVGFPPLGRSIVPGDRIAVALGDGVPDLLEVAAALVEAILRAGVEPAHVSLVTTTEADAKLLRDGLGDALPVGTRIVRHDPADATELCFAGVTREDDQSLMINRTLFDADLAIPVSCARASYDRESRGAYGGLYPAFADAECRKQYLRTAWERREWWTSRTEEAGWIIGMPFVVCVVPGPHGAVAAAVAGEPSQVDAQSQAAASSQWRCATEHQAPLVIATIAGEPDRQSWDDLARALVAADLAATPDGAVVVCCEIDLPIGRSLARLREEGDPDAALDRLARDAHADTWAAQQIAQALLRGPLYLKSRLADSLVEELGMAPITQAAELERLASRFGSVTLLENAQHLELDTGDQE